MLNITPLINVEKCRPLSYNKEEFVLFFVHAQEGFFLLISVAILTISIVFYSL